jgi:quercetin dioxygenase-like cupin family protein
MKNKTQTILGMPVLLAGCLIAMPLGGQPTATHVRDVKHAEHKLVLADEIQWRTGPDSLPVGAQYVVLEGDPTKEGPFTMRLKLPPNYKIPPHTHPKIERVTVLKGEFRLGMGPQHNEQSMQRLSVGGFFVMPPGMEHFVTTDQETIVQLNGEGPWAIHYVNPADDPRQKRK